MIKLIFAFAAACVFSGCSATPTKEPPMSYNPNATVSLLPQTSTVIQPGITLRFERVDDSRCPPDVVCITAGKILYYFALIGSVGAEPFTLEPAAPTYKSVTVAPDLVIALTSEPPAPLPSTSPPAPPQAVVLTINP